MKSLNEWWCSLFSPKNPTEKIITPPEKIDVGQVNILVIYHNYLNEVVRATSTLTGHAYYMDWWNDSQILFNTSARSKFNRWLKESQENGSYDVAGHLIPVRRVLEIFPTFQPYMVEVESD